jgi:hypothetical protein
MAWQRYFCKSVIGEFLAKCRSGEDGIWPCVPVRQALEEVGTRDIIDGMVTGETQPRRCRM